MSQSVIGALRVNLGLDSAQFTQGMAQAQNRMADFGRQMQRIGAAVSVVGAGVAFAIRGQLRAADDLAKAASRIGMPVEELSRLQFAAELSAVSLSQLETGLRGMSRRMVESADDFAAAGVALRDADGNMRATTDVLADVADVMASMPEGAERTALAMELLGRSGADLVPLLAGGGAAMREMMVEADALGLTLSTDAANSAQAFNDNLTRLQRTVTGLWRQISSELAPVLEGVSAALVKAAAVFQGLSPEAQRFSAVVAGLTVVLGPLLVAAGLLVTALGALSAPVLAAVAALTALSALVAAFWPQLVELKEMGLQAIGDLVDGFWAFGESVKMAVSDAVDWIVAKFQEWVDFVVGLPAMMVQVGRDIIQGLIDGIRDKFGELRDALVELAAEYIPNWLKGPLGIQSPSTVMREIGGYLMDGLRLGINDGTSSVSSALQGVLGAMQTFFGQSKALGAAQALVNAFVGASEALKLPFPANLAAYAQTLAQGMAAVRGIRSATPGGSGGGVGTATPAALPVQRVIFDTQGQPAPMGMDRLVEMINEAGRKGYRLDIGFA